MEDEFGEVVLEITNEIRVIAVLKQAKGQIQAASGYPIRWEFSNLTGTDGISQIFTGNLGASMRNRPEFSGIDFSLIEVAFKP